MLIDSFEVANYKAYRQPTTVHLRPLTLFVGKNHAGKSALMKALPLLLGSLANKSPRVIDLNSFGLLHGLSESELVFGRHSHGAFELGLDVQQGAETKRFRARIQCVSEPGKAESSFVEHLELTSTALSIDLARRDGQYLLKYSHQGTSGEEKLTPIFDGLLPRSLRVGGEGPTALAIENALAELRTLGDSISYLGTPRSLRHGWQLFGKASTAEETCQGGHILELLATDDDLLDRTRRWFGEALGISLQVQKSGQAFRLLVGTGHGVDQYVGLENAGHGISQLLPVVVQRISGQSKVEGVDLVEQPEADLHPALHGAVADLFLDLLQQSRPAVIETHSEIFLLRVRRRIAERKLDPAAIAIYWVDKAPEGGAAIKEIKISHKGEVEDWPEGVFYEDYAEVLAIHRAVRERR